MRINDISIWENSYRWPESISYSMFLNRECIIRYIWYCFYFIDFPNTHMYIHIRFIYEKDGSLSAHECFKEFLRKGYWFLYDQISGISGYQNLWEHFCLFIKRKYCTYHYSIFFRGKFFYRKTIFSCCSCKNSWLYSNMSPKMSMFFSLSSKS